MKRLILEIRNGGLGDHLFYSHLPRIAKETGIYEEVLISNRSIFRNEDYKKLIWEMNPFIDGFTNESGIYFYPDSIEADENLLDRMMLLYGMDDGKRMHEPEIYYQPIAEKKWQNSSIYDPNYISYTGDLQRGELIENWFIENNITIDYQLKKLGKNYLSINCEDLIDKTSLFEFCSLLISCKRMYCLTTGTATLAAALKVPVTVLYGEGHLQLFRHSALHKYVNVGSDYTLMDKIKKQLRLFLVKYINLGPK